MENKCFHWATLRFSQSNSSIKCSLTLWLKIMNPIGLGSFLLAFFQLAVSGALMLYDLFTFFTIANALYYSAIMLVQFQKTSQPTETYIQSNLNASNRQFLFGDLSHIIISKLSTSELAPWYRSSPWCGYNSSLTSSVTLSVSDSAISLLWRLQPYGFRCQ